MASRRRPSQARTSWFQSLRNLLGTASGTGYIRRRPLHGRNDSVLSPRPLSEPLEDRVMLTLNVGSVGGDLVIAETSSGIDALTIDFDVQTNDYVITDSGQNLTTDIAAATGDGTKEIRVPVGEITGGLVVLTGGGDDSVTIAENFKDAGQLSVDLNLQAGTDTVTWSTSGYLQSVAVQAEQTTLDTYLVDTSGDQNWNTSLTLTQNTIFWGSAVTLRNVDANQKDFVVAAATSLLLTGEISNGGNADLVLESTGSVEIDNGSILGHTGSVSLTADTGGIIIRGAQLQSGNGDISLYGTSDVADVPGIQIINSSIASTGNGSLLILGTGGTNAHGVQLNSAGADLLTTKNGNLVIDGTAGFGNATGVRIKDYDLTSTGNGHLALAGRSHSNDIYGIEVLNSVVATSGNGEISMFSGTTEVEFGSGDNRFALSFADVADPGNTADTTGTPTPAGAVNYNYQMGRFEISREMIEKATAAGDLEITLQDMTNYGGNGSDRPATGISWYEAAQFVNWLNTSEGYSAAYKFVDGDFQLWSSDDPGYNSNNPYRNSNANYVLPTVDEWYKAAFYDPVTRTYYDYATSSDTAPSSVTSGTDANTAVYNHSESTGPADVTNAGGLSPYGMMAMSGNVYEWMETAADSQNNSATEDRRMRGGAYWTNRNVTTAISSSGGFAYAPTNETVNAGFRVVNLGQETNGRILLDGVQMTADSTSISVDGRLNAVDTELTAHAEGVAVTSQFGGISLTNSELHSNDFGISVQADASKDGGIGLTLNNTRALSTAAGSIVLRGAGSTGNSGILLQGDGTQTSQIATNNGTIILQGLAGDDEDAVVATKYSVTTTGEGSIEVLGSVNGTGTYAFSATDSTIAATGSGSIEIRAESRQYHFGDTSAYGSGDPAALEIDFTTIGQPGNDDDTTGKPNPAGKVDYVYQIGTYEISRGQIEAYNAAWGTANGLAISLKNMTNQGGNGVNRAATGVSWNEAARFVNWLNTSQGYQPAYKFTTTGVNDNIALWTSADAGYDSTNPYRNSLAKYVLPSMDEWYKAAYYDPATSTYRDYSSADGTLPTAVKSGTAPNTAVYNQSSSTGPADYNQAGGLNAFGVMGMSGNLWEWEETSLDLSNSSPGLRRALNGGSFEVTADGISSSSRGNHDSTHEAAGSFGFRVATLLTHNPTEILLNHTRLRINTGELLVDAENIVLQGQESFLITTAADQLIASDFSGTGHLRKLGAAQLTLSGDYATSAVIYVRAGTLNIAGTVSGNIVTESDANGFGTLVGSGAITGNVTASGNSVIAPGGSAGILSTGKLDLQSAANLQVELGGSTAGNSASSHDQVVVTGQVLLAGHLELSLINDFIPGIGDAFLLISNDGTDAISGTFEGLAEGDQFAAQGISWQISYVGGTGNDVAITRLGSVFDVVNVDVSGDGSLAQAITDANATAGGDWIRILTTGILPVSSTTVLPAITEKVLIDGTTAPGYDDAPLFEIRGTNAGATSGLRFTATADLSQLQGLSITDFSEHGVRIAADDMTLTRNWIGVTVAGTELGNAEAGISINSAGTKIGGSSESQRNIISGNQVGIELTGPDAEENWILGNDIGLNPAGTAAFANNTGIRIDKGANRNIVGTNGDGTADGSEGNVISGNKYGITVSHTDRDGNSPADNTYTELNVISGNLIGTKPSGTEVLGNTEYGIGLGTAVRSNRIGSDGNGTADAAERNVISGNVIGVLVQGDSNVITGNEIGTDVTGEVDLGNALDGIRITAGTQNQIGGNSAAKRNVISGNESSAIRVQGSTTAETVIHGNYLGVSATGAELPNSYGVFVEDATATQVGGSGSGEGNVISGNDDQGVYLHDAPQTLIRGNFIGTTVDGTTARPNRIGIYLRANTTGTVIGGADGENIISGNNAYGIYANLSTGGLQIAGNLIGTNAAGDAAVPNKVGILVKADDILIGGTSAADQNVISGNSIDGIRFAYDSTLQNTGNLVQGNLIGLAADGTTSLGNAEVGVQILTSAVQVGGSSVLSNGVLSGAGNVIGGNKIGVEITGPNATDNIIQGNHIGVTSKGTAAAANEVGIRIDYGAGKNLIGTDGDGSSDAAEGNLISGNTLSGILLSHANRANENPPAGTTTADNTIAGNLIGTSVTGSAALANDGDGILITADVKSTLIGSDGDGTSDSIERNLISGNKGTGILIHGTDNIVAGNIIGLNLDESAALANDGYGGIGLFGDANLIGGTSAAQRNIIAGNNKNSDAGIYISGGDENTVQGNYVGLNSSGTAIGNSRGISLRNGADATLIGGTGTGEGNVIGGHGNGEGIYVDDSEATLIQGNLIGTTPDGTEARPNHHGIFLTGAVEETLIGGSADGENIISGSLYVGIYLERTVGNVEISGNLIGTNLSGDAALGNEDGIVVIGDFVQIGGTTTAQQNVISGNTRYGIDFRYHSSLQQTGNVVQGNQIGTDATGLGALANANSGIRIATDNVRIGGVNSSSSGIAGAGNVISGNSRHGIEILSTADAAQIQGNLIGVTKLGDLALPNGLSGIFVAGSNTLIGTNGDGTSDDGEANVISGNTLHGIHADGATDLTIAGNLIGLKQAGDAALFNQDYGIRLDDSGDVQIGGGDGISGNVIASLDGGIGIFDGDGEITIAGNIIGLSADEETRLNGGTGIYVERTEDLIIGTDGDGTNDAAEGNVIGGSSAIGIHLAKLANDTDLRTTESVIIAGNDIGIRSDGSGSADVYNSTSEVYSQVTGVRIGTDGDGQSDSAEQNVITHQKTGGSGITLAGESAAFNVIAGNRIGLTPSDTTELGFNTYAIRLSSGAHNNRIGTDGSDDASNAAEANLIAAGLQINAADDNTIAGNYFNTTADGTTAIPAVNYVFGAIELRGGASGNIIGTNDDGQGDDLEGNVMAVGFGRSLIEITGAGTDDNVIAGNLMNISTTGATLKSTERGIYIYGGASGTRIGTDGDGQSDSDERNVIGGTQKAILIEGVGTDGTVIAGNYLGVDPTGELQRKNIVQISIWAGAGNTRIGTDGSDDAFNANERNVIAGGQDGINITSLAGNYQTMPDNKAKTDGVAIAGNYIGLTASGAPLGHSRWGINASDQVLNLRVGTNSDGIADESERNVISGNGYWGVGIAGWSTINQFVLAELLNDRIDVTTAESTIAQADLYYASGTGSDTTGHWDYDNAIPGGGSSKYGLKSTGTLTVATQSEYTFAISGDDGGWLNINGTRVVDRYNVSSFGDTRGKITLSPGTYELEWTGYANTGVSGFELSVAVGDVTTDITAANGWKVLGDASPHPEIALQGNLTVKAYYPNPGELNAVVAGNYIGTSADGTADVGNNDSGVIITADGVTVGGTTASARNIISGNNSTGVIFADARLAHTGNRLQGNYIGVAVDGTTALPNGTLAGVSAVSIGADNVQIGGIGGFSGLAGGGNLISGSKGYGIELLETASGNVIQGNYIGTNASGTAALANAFEGVLVLGSDNTIGGTSTGAGNLISGNTQNGVLISGGDGNSLWGNRIGSNAAGTAALANGSNGIMVSSGASDTRIGSGTSGARNLISGHSLSGIVFTEAGTGNVIQGNYIGTAISGAVALGNASEAGETSAGILIYDNGDSQVLIGTDGDGTADAAEGNLISGNLQSGILISGGSSSAGGHTVAGNNIGVNAGLNVALPNHGSGVMIVNSGNNLIGSDGDGTADSVEANQIAGNSNSSAADATEYASGVVVVDSASNDSNLTLQNIIAGNAIGTDRLGEKPLPNQGNGITIVAAKGTQVGAAGIPNLLRFNSLAGLHIEGTTDEGVQAHAETSLQANSFQANTGLPVDLGTTGVTINDSGDSITDFPVFTSAAIEDGVMTLIGFAEPGLVFDLYLNAGQVGQEFGDGVTWIARFTEGSEADKDATTGSYGPELRGVTVSDGTITQNRFEFSFAVPDGVSNGVQMTGIASTGGVSEFSSLILAGEQGSAIEPEITLDNDTDPVLLNELQTLSVDGSFYDPDSTSWTATVDYGDGDGPVALALSAARTFTLEHIYDTPGSYTVTVQIVDAGLAAGSATFGVTVANVDPVVDYSTFAFTEAADEGGTVELSGSFTDGLGAHVVEITWGDSQTSTIELASGIFSFATSHIYADDSNSSGSTTSSDIYSVDITIRDASEPDGTDSAEGVFLTEISNVRPTLDSLLFNGSELAADATLELNEGATLALTGTLTDPGLADVHTVTIDWGDGTTVEVDLTAGDRTFGGTSDFSHIYADDNVDAYTVVIELWDDDEPAQRTTLTRSVQVLDVAASSISVTALPSSISEGESIEVSGSFVDPGTTDSHQVRVIWGDGTPDSILNVAAGVLTFGGSSLTHTYRNNAAGGADYDIEVIVSDLADVTAAGSGTDSVSVANVAPVAGTPVVKRLDGTVGAIEEGSRVVVTGSFSDVSSLDRHQVTINWGDGTTSSAAVDAMTRTYSATHRYLDNYAAAEITATVIDGRYTGATFTADGGSVTSASVTQVITNVAPTPTIAPVAGSTPTVTKLVAEVVDPGLNDIPDLTYTWQADTGLGYTTVATTKIFTFDSTTYTQPMIRLLVSDDDGGDGEDEVIAVFGTDVAETITITDTGATLSSGGGGGLGGGLGGLTWHDRILVLGFAGQDFLNASALSSGFTAILDGGQEQDYLYGGNGEDVFYPNDGNDTVDGGAGDDNYFLTPNSTLTVIDTSGDNTLDFTRSEFGDATGVVFDLTKIRNSGVPNADLDTQLVSTSGGTNHEVAAFGNFTALVGSAYGDDLTIGSNDTVDGGAGEDTINIGDNTSGASVSGGADDDLLIVSGTNVSELTFSGDDGLDIMRNTGEITGLTFGGGADDDILENTGSILGTLNFGGDDGIDILTNTGTIGELIFNGGADDDIFINNGAIDTTLNFGGDEDILLSGTGTIESLNFGGDDGADIFANLGTITSLTFNGGADDDIFINVGSATSLNFGGDDDVLLNGGGTIGTLVFSGDDGIDEFRNFGEITTLTFNGGADNDIFTNYTGGTLTSLTFGGDDGLDLLQNAGTISGLTFSGGADDDTLLNTADGTLTSLTFGGDDGSDILNNFGTINGLTFSGGADDDILTNVGTINSTLVFGGDDGIDTLQNTGTIAELNFSGGADDDILTNFAGGVMTTLAFGGDDGIDTLGNYGTVTTLNFGGGADEDTFVNGTTGTITTLFFGGDYESDGDGGFTPIANLADDGADILGNYGAITDLMFRGGADDDIFVNYDGGSLGTLNFSGDDGLDQLQNAGTVASLTFGGGADDDTLINTGTVTGTLVFGGDQQFSLTDELEQIDNAADDGVDILANYGTLGGISFTGGADDDILLNDTTGTVGDLVFSGDAGADILRNLGTVTNLTFNGGADDDLLVNTGSGISALVFGGDDGADILLNEGSGITDLTFSGGADDDLLLNTASSVTNLTFSGGADDDVFQNSGSTITTLSFSGDDGLDVLLNTGSGVSTLSFGGGADDDTLRSTGDSIGVIIFGGDIDSDTGEPIAGTNGGKDTLIVSGSGTGAAGSRILFSGDDGIDAFQNDASGFASIIFNGGADDDVFLNNAGSIGGLVFNGGADDDVLENTGDSLTSLVFSGDDGADQLYNTGDSVAGLTFTGGADDDVLINTGSGLSGTVFSGDDGADIFSNTGADLTSLTFTGGADNDIFVNTGTGISAINFSGDDGADLFWNKATGLDASNLSFSGDDGADIFVNEAGGVNGITFTGGADDDALQNSGVNVGDLVFSGGADDDTLLNTSTGSILNLSFGGDDGSDILQTNGTVTTLNFGGGADDDTLVVQGTVDTLVFMGDGELDNEDNLQQISVAADDGVDTLLNEATVTSLTFTGGADDDIFVNNNTVTSLTFSGGADDDTFQNNALVTSLVFSGGADEDMLINNASSMPALTFSGDDGNDTFVNNGNDMTSLTFEGGADDDTLRIHGTGIGTITFTGGADAGADTFHYNGTGAAGSSVTFTGGDGDDIFAWRGSADTASFDAGAGNDTSIILGTGSLTLTGGSGNDGVLFQADPDADVQIIETWTGDDDSSSDTLDFSSFTGGALNIDLRSTSAQAMSGSLSITLSDSRGIENVIGTAGADTIYGNAQDNSILGAEYSDGYSGDTAGDRGVTQWVLLDFDTYSEDGEHVYTQDERDQIQDRVESIYRGSDTNNPVFDVKVRQDRGDIPVADGEFVTISFNDTPAFGRPGGLASEIDPGNLNLGGTAVVQVNGLLGGTITSDDEGYEGGDAGGDKGFSLRPISDNPVGVAKPDATSENFVLLSAKIAAHELAHLMGLRHQDSFGPIGLGVHDPPGLDGYNPTYPGPVGAVETFDHLLGSGASVGTDRFNDLRDLFFSERSAMKLAFAEASPSDVFTTESTSSHGTSATAQELPLTTVDVPNTLSTGLNAPKVFYVQMQSVEGTIEVDSATGTSESDWYYFTGTSGDVMNIELYSNSLIRYGTTADDYVDSILRVWYDVDGVLTLVPWFGGEAVNDDVFEPTDSALVDLVLPEDGVYWIEVDTFKRDPSDPLFDPTNPDSPLNPDNPNNFLSYPDLLKRFTDTRDDTDEGNYQLVVSRFDRGSASDDVDTIVGYGGTDTIDAGTGDDYSLTVTVGGAGTVDEGSTFTRNISLVDRAAISWSGSTVNYGDGTGDIAVTVASDGTATLTHTFADSGVYTVAVTIRDDIGQEVTENIEVTVNNLAPTVDTLTGDTSPNESTTETYSFTASDVGDDTFAVAEITGGTLGTVSNISINPATGSGTFDVAFGAVTSGATETTTLTVKLKDSDDAESNVLTLDVAVQNVGSGPEDLALSPATIAENADSGTEIGTLTTTDSSGQTSFTYTLVSGDGDTDNALFTITGDKLLSAAVFDYEEAATRSIRVQTADPSGNTYQEAVTISITNITDEEAPSSAINTLPTNAVSTTFSVTVAGTDSGDPASGIASFDLYYSTGGDFTQFATVTPASPSAEFSGNTNTKYWFRSLATDAAGNAESKNSADTYTIIGDIEPGTSEVTSVTEGAGVLILDISGAKSEGRPLTTFDVYLSIDDGAVEKVASVNAVEVSTGVFSGAVNIQGIVDGASHKYDFYTRAVDASGNVEDAPGTADKSVTVIFSSGSSLEAQTIDVQRGANQRSYIRYLDVFFSGDPSELLEADRVAIERFDLDAAADSVNPGTGTAVSTGTMTVADNKLSFDFGSTGLGGVKSLGNGFYRVLIDMDGDGSRTGGDDAAFEFYRLFGDANGDREVNNSDITLVRKQMRRSGDNLDGDIDGSGRVDGRDFLWVRRNRGQKLRSWLFGWLDD